MRMRTESKILPFVAAFAFAILPGTALAHG